MADIELVIKIPEKDWEFVKASDGCRYSRAILDGVINGTPLPPHGDLIDRDALIARGCYWETEYEMSKAPTILEADKAGKEQE